MNTPSPPQEAPPRRTSLSAHFQTDFSSRTPVIRPFFGSSDTRHRGIPGILPHPPPVHPDTITTCYSLVLPGPPAPGPAVALPRDPTWTRRHRLQCDLGHPSALARYSTLPCHPKKASVHVRSAPVSLHPYRSPWHTHAPLLRFKDIYCSHSPHRAALVAHIPRTPVRLTLLPAQPHTSYMPMVFSSLSHSHRPAHGPHPVRAFLTGELCGYA